MVTRSVAALPKAINNPVKNCELSEPSMVIFFGCNGPLILMGNFPLLDSIAISSLGKISSKKFIGLVNRLPVPLITIGLLLNAAIGANILIPKPLSPQFISSLIG